MTVPVRRVVQIAVSSCYDRHARDEVFTLIALDEHGTMWWTDRLVPRDDQGELTKLFWRQVPSLPGYDERE